MKRVFLYMTVALLVMTQGVWAQDAAMVNGIAYEFNREDHTAKLVGLSNYGKYKGDIVVPDYVNYDGTDFAVTIIGDGAFADAMLTSLQLPKETLRIIEDVAFTDCTGVTDIEIPEGVTAIGASAFDCLDLEHIHIPASVTKMGVSAVGGPQLESITMAEGNTHYGVFDGVLMDAAQTDIICYPARKPGSTYTIPATVTTIDRKAFQNLTFLTTLNVPASVAVLDNNTFFSALSLAEINIDPAHTAYCSVDGVVYSADKETLWLYPAGKPDETYTIGAATKTIGRTAFSNAVYLQTVIIPEGVTTIDDSAFFRCSALKNVDFSSSVTSLGMTTFFQCLSLETIVLPQHLTELPIGLLSGCTRLRSVTLQADVNFIGMSPFLGCDNLEEITCLAITPPSLGLMPFEGVTVNKITLYVPDESVDLYKATPIWQDFIVQPVSQTGIGDAARLNEKEETKNRNWYTLDGRQLDSKPTKKGVYIHNGVKIHL